VAENGLDLTPALATRDPQVIGKALMSVKTQMSLAELNRQIKTSAQTMSGGNSAPDSTSEWAKIAAAKGLPSIRF
jgi:hypothetical protein